MAVSDYKTNPDLNTTISGINIAEGCPPSGINNAIRQLMADVKADSDEQDTAISNAQTTAEEAKGTADGKVSKSGDTMTGMLTWTIPDLDTVHALLAVADPKEINNFLYTSRPSGDGTGSNILLCAGCMTVIASGESGASFMAENASTNTERLIMISDGEINFYTNAQNYANKVALSITTNNHIRFNNNAEIWVE